MSNISNVNNNFGNSALSNLANGNNSLEQSSVSSLNQAGVDPSVTAMEQFQSQQDSGEEAEEMAATKEQFRHKEVDDILQKTQP